MKKEYKCPNSGDGCKVTGCKPALIVHLKEGCPYGPNTYERSGDVFMPKTEEWFDKFLAPFVIGVK